MLACRFYALTPCRSQSSSRKRGEHVLGLLRPSRPTAFTSLRYPATGLCTEAVNSSSVAPRPPQSLKSATLLLYATVTYARSFRRSQAAPRLIYFARSRVTAHCNFPCITVCPSGQDRTKTRSLPCSIYCPYSFGCIFLFTLIISVSHRSAHSVIILTSSLSLGTAVYDSSLSPARLHRHD